MQSEATVAIGKAIKEKVLKQASKDVEPGTYNVDMLVRVLGSFTKGEDYQTKVPNSVNWTLAFALALSKVNNETRAKIVQSVVAAMANGKDSPESKSLADQIKAEVQTKLDEIKAQTEITASGKVTTNLTTELVGGGKIEKSS